MRLASRVTPIQRNGLNAPAALLFHFQIDRRLGAKPQTVQTPGKAKQQQILLIWSGNEAFS